MPRYFFYLFNGQAFRDEDGTELRNEDAARAVAVRSLAQMVGDHSERFWRGEEWTMQVVDATGRQVCMLKFRAEP